MQYVDKNGKVNWKWIFQCELNVEQHNWLGELARAERRSMIQMVLYLIDKAIEEHRSKTWDAIDVKHGSMPVKRGRPPKPKDAPIIEEAEEEEKKPEPDNYQGGKFQWNGYISPEDMIKKEGLNENGSETA